MKKSFLALLICFVSMALHAQTTNGWTNNVTTCFCCNGIYNLPTPPVISGPASVNCGDAAKFCVVPCPGATIAWTVSPTITFTGQGTNCITLTPPLTAAAYTIYVTIKCGNKVVENKTVVQVNLIQNCTPLFTATFTPLAGGIGLNINTVPVTTSGAEHYWGIQYNGTYPSCLPCVSIPFANFSNPSANGIYGGKVPASGGFTAIGLGTLKTGGTSGYGINYSGFPINSCFKITHYINCCGVWLKQTLCYTATTSLKVIPGTPLMLDVNKTEIEKVEWKDLPKELQVNTEQKRD